MLGQFGLGRWALQIMASEASQRGAARRLIRLHRCVHIGRWQCKRSRRWPGHVQAAGDEAWVGPVVGRMRRVVLSVWVAVAVTVAVTLMRCDRSGHEADARPRSSAYLRRDLIAMGRQSLQGGVHLLLCRRFVGQDRVHRVRRYTQHRHKRADSEQRDERLVRLRGAWTGNYVTLSARPNPQLSWLSWVAFAIVSSLARPDGRRACHKPCAQWGVRA